MNYKYFIFFLIGMAFSDFLWWLRLRKEWALKEMIFYLSEGDISVFYDMAIIILGLTIIFAVVLLYFENKKKEVKINE